MSIHQVYIETERLIIRSITHDDVDGMFELDSNPNVHKYLGDHMVKTKEESIKIIDYIRQQYDDFGVGRLAVLLKESKTFIGWTGLKFIDEETNGRINFHDIGYRFIERFWGKGFATESAKASLEFGFNSLNLNAIHGMADVDNIASNVVLKKLGMAYKNKFYYDNNNHNFYTLLKSDWLEKQNI